MNIATPLALAALVLTLGCSTKAPIDQVNQADLKTYFDAQIKKIDSQATVEAFQMVGVDTVTLKDQLNELGWAMNKQQNKNQQELAEVIKQAKLYGQADLPDLARTSLNEAKELMAAEKLLDGDHQEVAVRYAVADSTKPVAFAARCAYSVKGPDKSTLKDTTLIMLDTQMDIIDTQVYRQRLSQLHKSRSGFTIKP